MIRAAVLAASLAFCATATAAERPVWIGPTPHLAFDRSGVLPGDVRPPIASLLGRWQMAGLTEGSERGPDFAGWGGHQARGAHFGSRVIEELGREIREEWEREDREREKRKRDQERQRFHDGWGPDASGGSTHDTDRWGGSNFGNGQ